MRATTMACGVLAGLMAWGSAQADGPRWRDARDAERPVEAKRGWRDGPCTVKEERKGRDSLLEVKCKDGVGADWGGEWKDEFRDGRCVVRIDAKRDEYKEEVKCDR